MNTSATALNLSLGQIAAGDWILRQQANAPASAGPETAAADEAPPARRALPSPDEFADCVRLHQALVFSILHRYERDIQKLEDLAQETFIRAWRAWRQHEPERAPFSHWLSRIAVRVALDHLRREKKRRQEIPFSQLGEAAVEWLKNSAGDRDPAPQEAREILDAGLRKLSPEERLVLTLLELEDKPVREISRLTGWSGVTVRVRAHRARAKLKKALQKFYIPE